MDFWNEPYERKMKAVDVDLLCTGESCACSVTIAKYKITHFSASFRVLAAMKFQKGEATVSYYGTLVYY